MNIIIEQKNHSRIIDGINMLLNLDQESFETVINNLSVNKRNLDHLNFFYITDEYEVKSAKMQIGLEKEIGEDSKYIGRCYLTEEEFSIFKIFSKIEEQKEK